MSVTLERIDIAPFGAATHLVCRACGAHAKLGADYSCWECFGPLEVAYDFGTVRENRSNRVRSLCGVMPHYCQFRQTFRSHAI